MIQNHVWILGKDTYESRRLIEEFNKTKLSISRIWYDDLIFPLSDIPEACLIRSAPRLLMPHSVIFLLNIIECLENEGCTVIPSSNALKTCDKMSFYLFWKQNLESRIKMPRTFISTNLEKIKKQFPESHPCVFKPIIGGMGRDVELIHLNDPKIDALKEKHGIILLQEYVPNLNYDIRTIMIKNQKPVQYMRFDEKDFRHNIHQGGTGKTMVEIKKLDPNIEDHLKLSREIGHEIQIKLKLPIFGLDTLPGRDGQLYLLEINPFVGFQGAEQTLNGTADESNVAKKFVECLQSLISNR
ncbi:MAG: ATP-grasp domain-containing protein [Candidatus Helarchaeales archaeon]